MSKRFQIKLVVLAVVSAFLFFVLRSKNMPVSVENSQGNLSEVLAEPVPAPEAAAKALATESRSSETTDEIKKIRQDKFGSALAGLNSCLQLQMELSDSQEPTVENLLNMLRNVAGEPVVRNEDWSSTLIQLPNGEQRRIRVEMDYVTDEFIRKLKYEIVHQGGESKIIPIANEQSENPTETFIAGLESDGKIIIKENRARVYFPNGAEVLYNEKNGLLTTIEISMVDSKKFKCTQLDTAESSCLCR